MKILIACDMEGITGVVHVDQTTPGHAEYERFRRLMTADANAAIRGAFAAGADEVIVSDGHAGQPQHPDRGTRQPRPAELGFAVPLLDGGGDRRRSGWGGVRGLPRADGDPERRARPHLVIGTCGRSLAERRSSARSA